MENSNLTQKSSANIHKSYRLTKDQSIYIYVCTFVCSCLKCVRTRVALAQHYIQVRCYRRSSFYMSISLKPRQKHQLHIFILLLLLFYCPRNSVFIFVILIMITNIFPHASIPSIHPYCNVFVYFLCCMPWKMLIHSVDQRIIKIRLSFNSSNSINNVQ